MTKYATGFVISADGTKIGYRQLGHGPKLLLIHGGMMAAQSLMELATLLSDRFTVYIPDRRGRGLSGEYGSNYSLKKECQDIAAIINKTRAENIFGLSSGAVIVLESACLFSSIRKIALYEPPLPINGPMPTKWIERYERELVQGKLASAMVTIIKGRGDPGSMITLLPRFILTPLLKLAIAADDKRAESGYVPIKKLIPTMHYDILIVSEMQGKFETLKDIKARVLLLGGDKSATFRKVILDNLNKVLPQSQLVQLSGAGHTAANNGEKPAMVANELKKFFLA